MYHFTSFFLKYKPNLLVNKALLLLMNVYKNVVLNCFGRHRPSTGNIEYVLNVFLFVFFLTCS